MPDMLWPARAPSNTVQGRSFQKASHSTEDAIEHLLWAISEGWADLPVRTDSRADFQIALEMILNYLLQECRVKLQRTYSCEGESGG